MKRFVLSILLSALTLGTAVFLAACAGGTAEKWNGVSGIKVPWGDYEEFVYKYTADGKQAADIKFTVEKTEFNGAEVFKIQDSLLLSQGEFVTGAVVEAGTLKPISSFYTNRPPEQYKNNTIEITGEYRDKLYITAKSAKGTQKFQVKLSGESLDNESSVMALRAMPLSDGFSKVINLDILSTAKSAPFEVRVTGKEKVSVPYGEAECHVVEFQYKGLMPAPAIKLWYTADDKKIMMKYSQNKTVFELKSAKFEK